MTWAEMNRPGGTLGSVIVAPFSVLMTRPPSPHRLQFADHPLDHREADAPEGRIARIEAERREQLRIGLRSARRKHRKISFREAFARALVDAVERIDEAVAERIGVDVEGRMDEMADIGPVGLVTGLELDRGAEAFG